MELAGAEPEVEPDFLWASAIAGFAEILKGSPYADYSELSIIREIVRTQSMRDDERARFAGHLEEAVRMLGEPESP